MAAGVEAEGAWRTGEFHAGFFGRAVALSVIAGMAAGDEVFPSGLARSGAWDDVVEGHFAGWKAFVAILAGVTVAHQNVFAREGASLMRNTAVFQQANNGRHIQSALGGVNLRWS